MLTGHPEARGRNPRGKTRFLPIAIQKLIPSEVRAFHPSDEPQQRGEIRMTHETIAPAKTEGQHQRPPIVYLVDDDMSFLRALSRLARDGEKIR
jgi:hypothetical protein